VWAATHAVTRKMVALKFLKGADASRSDVRRRFVREARAATAVRHPNVVEIHDIFELEDGSPVMVMDLLVGQSLGARRRQQSVLPPSEMAALLLPVVSAVGTAHALGIVHRDLKPDNIFIVDLGEGKKDVRVLDFGIAKMTASDGEAAHTGGLTQTGDMLGTPHYMAPEQASGETDIDHRADIWALGVIFYECLAGHRPIMGNNLGQILKQIITGNIVRFADAAPDAPEDLKTLIDSMLQPDREKRPTDLRTVQEVLSRYTDVQVPAFAEARARVSSVSQPSLPEAVDPHQATITPTKDELKRKNKDARWQAPTFSLPTPSRRRRISLWVGGSVAVLIGAVSAVEISRRHSPGVAPTLPVVNVTEPSPQASARPAPLVEQSQPVTAPAEPPPAAATKHVRREKRVREAPVAPVPAAPPTQPEKRLPGGVPEKPPY